LPSVTQVVELVDLQRRVGLLIEVDGDRDEATSTRSSWI